MDSQMDKKEFLKKWESQALVYVTEDQTSAYLTLFDSLEGEEYELEDIKQLLEYHNITYGLNMELVERMWNEHIYYEDTLIASGIPPVEGTDGYFDYLFDINPTKKPIILEDGSVDYNTLGLLVLRKKGDLLVQYRPAEPGENGISIYDKVISAKPVREQQPLKGKGFVMTEDRLLYFADKDGKVELVQDKLFISEVYLVDGDVDASTGNIYFNGDVVVRGNVFSGVTIEAEGNIVVNGHVEIALLNAGKDVLLKNGMQGAERGRICAKGNVFAKFFELTDVKAGGSVNANTIMNCNIESETEVIVSGKRGAIIGGTTKAMERISASEVGNFAETRTEIVLGVDADFKDQLLSIDKLIHQLQEQIKEIEKEMIPILIRLKKQPTNALQVTARDMLMKKIETEGRYQNSMEQKEQLLERKRRSIDSVLEVHRCLYSYSDVTINGVNKNLQHSIQNVVVTERKKDLHFYTPDTDLKRRN